MTTPEGNAERPLAPGGRGNDQRPAVVVAPPRRRASALSEVPRARARSVDPSPRPRVLDRPPAPPPPGAGRLAPVRHLYDVDLEAEDDPSPVPLAPAVPRHRAPTRSFRPAGFVPSPAPPAGPAPVASPPASPSASPSPS